MANVSFYLKDSKKPSSLIFARFSFNYFEIDENGKKVFKFLKYSTGETINPKFWDNETQRAIETKKFPEYPEFNQRLDTLKTAINNIHRQMLNDGQILNPESLKEKVKEHLIKNNNVVNPPKQTESFTAFIKTIMAEMKRGERTTKNGTIFKPRTIINYNATLQNILEYETTTGKKLKFSDININFYNKFVKHFNKKSYAVNTIGGYIKNIKVFMKIATDRKLNNLLDFKDENFRKVEEDIQTIYLTEPELTKIYELDLTGNDSVEIINKKGVKENISKRSLSTARDIFIIGCYTGLRFSDLKQLRKEHFNSNVIKIDTIKTGETVVIPLHWTVKEICNKYEFNLPRVISNQKMNEYLKVLGELAKINETVIITGTRGGLRVERKVKKYELISAHTSRRSFATNMFKAKIPSIAIMKITGHKTEKSFLKYIKISNDENAEMLLQHPFFNQSMNLKVV